MKTKALIIDIDGTIADCTHRRLAALKPDGKMDWSIFYKDMDKDKPIPWCIELVQKYMFTHNILFVTGRSEEYREATLNWIMKYVTDTGYTGNILFMRKPKDFREDYVIKLEIYKEHIEPYYDVEFCIDDRQQVVDMWRAQGLVCLQCDKGNF